jgi:hypothetical protein
MRALWLFHRRPVLAIGMALALVVVIGIAAATNGAGGRHAGAIVAAPTFRRGPASTTLPASTPRYTPSTVEPAATATQTSIDSRLAQAESPSSIAAAEVLAVPAPRDSSAYPAVPAEARESPIAYASSFTTELLDRNYRHQSRAELLAWAQAEESPNTLPGVPASIANKALYASLADPAMPGGTGASPVPSVKGWAADANAGTSQRVIDVLVTVDPAWTQIIDQGWEPRDPLMSMMDVTGTLIVGNGATTARHAVSMVLAVGSCDRVLGLGAMAVQNWTVR